MPNAAINPHRMQNPDATIRDVDGKLPLANEGMLTCSTCHNPHQQGIIKAPLNRLRAQFRP